MSKRVLISQEQVSEILTARKKNKCKKVDRRLKVLLLHAEGLSRAEISEKTEYKPDTVSKLVVKFSKNGLDAIAGNHYKGNHRNLSFEQEVALLEPFKAAAKEGKVVDVKEIKKVYDEALGRSTDKDKGRIYRVLKRHGWRKVMPRSKHPNKASDEVIETSKKLKFSSEMQWQMMT
ncbi:MAG: helix-turn-helix domain-containing protein [Defluviitaleaceae bacterium]|nr:helix-turn-helix domain-containing protein [Defluviitaleaceae bacterium]